MTRNRSGSWEIRESRSTPVGPRSTTLASFKTLEHHHLVLAAERSAGELDTDAVVAAARKAGAPVSLSAANQAALALLRAIGDRGEVDPHLRELLLDALSDGLNSELTSEALGHVGLSDELRGATAIDLLLLTDAIPRRDSWSSLEFPGMTDLGE